MIGGVTHDCIVGEVLNLGVIRWGLDWQALTMIKYFGIPKFLWQTIFEKKYHSGGVGCHIVLIPRLAVALGCSIKAGLNIEVSDLFSPFYGMAKLRMSALPPIKCCHVYPKVAGHFKIGFATLAQHAHLADIATLKVCGAACLFWIIFTWGGHNKI